VVSEMFMKYWECVSGGGIISVWVIDVIIGYI
jgi:hypothetical protein